MWMDRARAHGINGIFRALAFGAAALLLCSLGTNAAAAGSEDVDSWHKKLRYCTVKLRDFVEGLSTCKPGCERGLADKPETVTRCLRRKADDIDLIIASILEEEIVALNHAQDDFRAAERACASADPCQTTIVLDLGIPDASFTIEGWRTKVRTDARGHWRGSLAAGEYQIVVPGEVIGCKSPQKLRFAFEYSESVYQRTIDLKAKLKEKRCPRPSSPPAVEVRPPAKERGTRAPKVPATEKGVEPEPPPWPLFSRPDPVSAWFPGERVDGDDVLVATPLGYLTVPARWTSPTLLRGPHVGALFLGAAVSAGNAENFLSAYADGAEIRGASGTGLGRIDVALDYAVGGDGVRLSAWARFGDAFGDPDVVSQVTDGRPALFSAAGGFRLAGSPLDWLDLTGGLAVRYEEIERIFPTYPLPVPTLVTALNVQLRVRAPDDELCSLTVFSDAIGNVRVTDAPPDGKEDDWEFSSVGLDTPSEIPVRQDFGAEARYFWRRGERIRVGIIATYDGAAPDRLDVSIGAFRTKPDLAAIHIVGGGVEVRGIPLRGPDVPSDTAWAIRASGEAVFGVPDGPTARIRAVASWSRRWRDGATLQLSAFATVNPILYMSPFRTDTLYPAELARPLDGLIDNPSENVAWGVFGSWVNDVLRIRAATSGYAKAWERDLVSGVPETYDPTGWGPLAAGDRWGQARVDIDADLAFQIWSDVLWVGLAGKARFVRFGQVVGWDDSWTLLARVSLEFPRIATK